MGRRKRLNLEYIAKQFGVSIATVSRVINNKPDVKKETRDKILNFLEKEEYKTDSSRQSFRLIGIVDEDDRRLEDYYLTGLLSGIDRELQKNGYHMALLHLSVIEREIQEYGQALILNAFDGIIWSMPHFNDKYRQMLKLQQLPYVVINNAPKNKHYPVIISDNYHAARQGASLLIEKGHRRIGFLGGLSDVTNHIDRINGFRDEMESRGIPVKDELIIQDFQFWNKENGFNAMSRLIDQTEKPDAVILCSDHMADGAYEAIKTRGLSIPDDISIISFDNAPHIQLLDPPLTSFHQPLQEMGETAVIELINLIHGKKTRLKNGFNYVPMKLIERQSIRKKVSQMKST